MMQILGLLGIYFDAAVHSICHHPFTFIQIVTYKIIGDDFDLSVLKYSNTGVGGAKINSNCRSLCHFKCMKLPEK